MTSYEWVMLYFNVGAAVMLIAMLRSRGWSVVRGYSLPIMLVAFAMMLVLWPLCIRGFMASIVYRR